MQSKLQFHFELPHKTFESMFSFFLANNQATPFNCINSRRQKIYSWASKFFLSFYYFFYQKKLSIWWTLYSFTFLSIQFFMISLFIAKKILLVLWLWEWLSSNNTEWAWVKIIHFKSQVKPRLYGRLSWISQFKMEQKLNHFDITMEKDQKTMMNNCIAFYC